MISVLFITLFTQVLLILSGLALLQTINYKERIQVLPLIPYAWGAGVVLLYLGGRIFVKSEWLLHDWHLAVAGGMTALIVVGAVVYLRGQPGRDNSLAQNFSVSVRWYDVFIIALILLKISLVAYICMVNSVVDSDATGMRRYVGLAKKIGEGVNFSEIMERGDGHKDPIGPSLLSAWIRLFLDRWHSSVGSLFWLLAWLFSGSIAFVTCHRLSRHLTASLVCAYLFLSLPLAAIHVFRSGFHDLPAMYFLVMAASILSFAFLSRRKLDPVWLAAAAIAILGAALCKSESKIWALFMAVMWVNYYLHVYKSVSWKKLISVQISLTAVLFLIYHFVLGREFFEGFEDSRFRLMAPHAFDKQAFSITMQTLFLSGSFGIWWWGVGLAGLYLLIAKEVPENTKAMVFFVFSILLSIVYFSNFTENIKYTLNGTNVSRFLVQVSGLLLPLYCALILTWFPGMKKERHAP